MLTYPESTMCVRRIPMHLSSGHVTLMPGNLTPPPNFPQSDLGRRVDSRWALPQISSCCLFSYTFSAEVGRKTSHCGEGIKKNLSTAVDWQAATSASASEWDRESIASDLRHYSDVLSAGPKSWTDAAAEYFETRFITALDHCGRCGWQVYFFTLHF